MPRFYAYAVLSSMRTHPMLFGSGNESVLHPGTPALLRLAEQGVMPRMEPVQHPIRYAGKCGVPTWAIYGLDEGGGGWDADVLW